ncbi:MAG TPA: hypothetical protein VNF47_01565 [Streptosporangiaceae bacterium]|nr:hypothetical protein [Streptosporangiaceae bacterium]
MTATAQALQMLQAAGANRIQHPGGTLLAHVQRVSALLESWQASPPLTAAGLCHACYGTDGFPVRLLSLRDRPELEAVIGAEAEALVYFYASCDRKASYPELAKGRGLFTNRFTGARTTPDARERRDFAELTAANELDIAMVSPAFREREAAALLAMFTRWRPLLSEAAWKCCRTVLA